MSDELNKNDEPANAQASATATVRPLRYWIVRRYVVETYSIKARTREEAVALLGEGWYMAEQRVLKETAKLDKRK